MKSSIMIAALLCAYVQVSAMGGNKHRPDTSHRGNMRGEHISARKQSDGYHRQEAKQQRLTNTKKAHMPQREALESASNDSELSLLVTCLLQK